MSDLPTVFPAWLDRIQAKYVNPVIKPLAGRVPGLSLVKHRGRTSGRLYETPVSAFRKGDELAISLGHGRTDWVKNVLAAGEADVVMSGRQVHIVNPRIVADSSDVAALPASARLFARKISVLVADVT